jgi:hypothetical protein
MPKVYPKNQRVGYPQPRPQGGQDLLVGLRADLRGPRRPQLAPFEIANESPQGDRRADDRDRRRLLDQGRAPRRVRKRGPGRVEITGWYGATSASPTIRKSSLTASCCQSAGRNSRARGSASRGWLRWAPRAGAAHSRGYQRASRPTSRRQHQPQLLEASGGHTLEQDTGLLPGARCGDGGAGRIAVARGS